MKKSAWENLCKKCGKCCYNLVAHGDGTYHRQDEIHCKHYDKETKQCNVYKTRLSDAPNCKGLEKEDIKQYYKDGFLPKDCGYIEWYRKADEWMQPKVNHGR